MERGYIETELKISVTIHCIPKANVIVSKISSHESYDLKKLQLAKTKTTYILTRRWMQQTCGGSWQSILVLNTFCLLLICGRMLSAKLLRNDEIQLHVKHMIWGSSLITQKTHESHTYQGGAHCPGEHSGRVSAHWPSILKQIIVSYYKSAAETSLGKLLEMICL